MSIKKMAAKGAKAVGKSTLELIGEGFGINRKEVPKISEKENEKQKQIDYKSDEFDASEYIKLFRRSIGEKRKISTDELLRFEQNNKIGISSSLSQFAKMFIAEDRLEDVSDLEDKARVLNNRSDSNKEVSLKELNRKTENLLLMNRRIEQRFDQFLDMKKKELQRQRNSIDLFNKGKKENKVSKCCVISNQNESDSKKEDNLFFPLPKPPKPQKPKPPKPKPPKPKPNAPKSNAPKPNAPKISSNRRCEEKKALNQIGNIFVAYLVVRV
jgi:hypothetical protein